MENITKDCGIDMNERIKLLAEQAGFYYTPQTGFITPAGCDPAKFAELIIKDCMYLCNKESARFLRMDKLEWGMAIENLRIVIEDHYEITDEQ